MTAIVVALKIEADEIINFYKLKKDTNFKFQIYKNENIVLIISGTGTINSSIASTYLFCKFNNISHIYNIGIAGSFKTDINIGDIFLINKIHDISTGKDMYPDILLTHNLKENTLSTYPKKVLKNTDKKYTNLVDMEASGFFISCVNFINLEHISIIKIISDYCLTDAKDTVSKQLIKDIIKTNINTIDEFIKNYKIKQPKLLNDKNDNEISNILNQNNLSFCNKQKAIQKLKYETSKQKIINI